MIAVPYWLFAAMLISSVIGCVAVMALGLLFDSAEVMDDRPAYPDGADGE